MSIYSTMLKTTYQKSWALGLVLGGILGVLPACTKKVQTPSTSEPGEKKEFMVDTMKVEEIQVGTGKVAENKKLLTVHYSGFLTDGTKFDSSHDRSRPFQFTLGDGMVIPGWEKGFAGMKEGGKRKLTIPPEMAYGDSGAGGVIPPKATLVFDVELLKVE